MKKIISIFIILSVSLICVGCDSGNGKVTGSHLDIITGIINEIKEDGTLLVEISKDRGGYEKGEIVLIKYNKVEAYNTYLPDTVEDRSYPNYELKLKDEISTPVKSVKEKDGYDYIETESVSLEVYIPVDSEGVLLTSE